MKDVKKTGYFECGILEKSWEKKVMWHYWDIDVSIKMNLENVSITNSMRN